MTTVKERPILFSGPMVRAILEGRKTQTRRSIKPQPRIDEQGNFCWNGWNYGQDSSRRPHIQAIASPIPRSKTPRSKTKKVLCPYGKPGERLWVRESWSISSCYDGVAPRNIIHKPGIIYPASGMPIGLKIRPSIHMPRWASRILLEVTGVRVQRLQDISEEDAIAEGVEPVDTERYEQDSAICKNCGGTGLYTSYSMSGARPDTDCNECDTHKKRFKNLWESINGPGSWDKNDWVWAITFKKVES